MEFFSHRTKIDFMALRKKAVLFSAALFIFSISSLIINGLNFGLDFTGGTQFQLNYQQSPDFTQIRQELSQADFKDAQVQAYGSSQDVLVKIKPRKELNQQELTDKMKQILVGASIMRVEFIGPQVGEALVTNGILAVIIAMLGTMVYIALRFEYRFALSAALALIHDPIMILGLFSFFHIEFDLVALAAVLTVIGYSLNETIVIYDRVRENFRKLRKAPPEEVINLSVNQTLSRTIITAGLTFSVILALFFFGGQILHGFSLAMMIGIVIGTYSSIYISGSLAITFGLTRGSLAPTEKKLVDSMP